MPSPSWFARGLGEFRAEEENLRRVVDPEQEQHQGAGRAVARLDVRVRQVQSDQVLADGEEERGDERAVPDVSPGNPRLGEILEQEGEQQPYHAEGEEGVAGLREGGPGPEPAAEVAAEGAQSGAHEQRHEQENRHPHHHGEIHHRSEQKPLDSRIGLRFHIPNRVHGLLELLEERGRRPHHRDPAQEQGGDPGAAIRGPRDQGLKGARRRWSHNPGEMLHEASLDRLPAQANPATGNRNQQERASAKIA